VAALAASAASVIALAGETRTTSAGGRWMIHRAMAIAIGNADEMRKTVDVLETYDRSLVEIYSQYMGDANVLDLMSAETWYTADEAIAAGLSTGKAAESGAKAKVASWFRNAPACLLNAPVAELKPDPYPVARQAAKIRA
jgi:ATP-dependent protease ClpP protease subunit